MSVAHRGLEGAGVGAQPEQGRTRPGIAGRRCGGEATGRDRGGRHACGRRESAARGGVQAKATTQWGAHEEAMVARPRVTSRAVERRGRGRGPARPCGGATGRGAR